MISFVDSAYAPGLGQVVAAIDKGITAWGFYLAGPGALNNWTVAQVAVLKQGGMTQCLPIYVPKLNLTTPPAVDAQVFVNAMDAAGVYGVGALDTEASMRGNPRLRSYVDGFVAELRNLGVTPVVYGGGDYVPAGVNAWWILQGIPPAGTAYQWGSGSLAGISVDYDTAGPGFPMASFTPPTPIIPTKEQVMQAFVNPQGQVVVYAASPANHLLEFTKVTAAPGWSVIDVTDAIAAAFPADALFLVEA